MIQLRECLSDMCEAQKLVSSLNDLRPQEAKFLEKRAHGVEFGLAAGMAGDRANEGRAGTGSSAQLRDGSLGRLVTRATLGFRVRD